MTAFTLLGRWLTPEVGQSTDDRLNQYLASLRSYYVSGFPHYWG